MSKNYIFGYGSLINSNSLNKTITLNKGVIPVKLLKFKRNWNLIDKNEGATYLTLEENNDFFCNGVLIEVEESYFSHFDSRESFYKRIKLNLLDFEFYDNSEFTLFSDLDNFWVYIGLNEYNGKSSKEFPILQSYIDVIISGCLNISKEFLKDFIETTFFWDSYILNDRNSPKYLRNVENLDFKKIDDVLNLIGNN